LAQRSLLAIFSALHLALAKELHPLNSTAPLATILNDIFAVSVGGASFNLHRLDAYNAAQETYQWALIVIRMTHSYRGALALPALGATGNKY
jgi:hypothetical protein